MKKWFPYRTFQTNSKFRLFCLHHSGGSASVFRYWHKYLPPEIEICPIQLPGRENRYSEKFIYSIETFLDEFIPVLRPLLDRPFSFFGHSLGGLLGYKISAALGQNSHFLKHFFVSASLPPQHLDRNRQLHKLPDEEFTQMIISYGGMKEPILKNKELLQILINRLRADFSLYESFQSQEELPLSVPISVMSANSDEIAPVELLKGWQNLTTSKFNFLEFHGDHFYYESQGEKICLYIQEKVRPFLEPALP